MHGLWVAAWKQSPAEFWDASPDQFYAIYDAWLEIQSTDYLTAGTIVATLMNVNRSRHGRTYTAEDVFPSLKGLKQLPTQKELVERLKAQFGYYDRKDTN